MLQENVENLCSNVDLVLVNIPPSISTLVTQIISSLRDCESRRRLKLL